MRNRLFLILIFLTLSSIPVSLSAQRYFNSPLSRFNLGTLENSGSFRSLAMGGTGMAIRTNDIIYFNNPSSYSSLDTNSFVFDFAVDYKILSLAEESGSYMSDDMGFHHFTIGFPLAKKWGAALGIMPYSNSYYELEGEDDLGSTVYHYGEGGLNRIFFGVGTEVWNGLSIGLNMNVLYGEISRVNYYMFDDDNVNNVLKTEYLYLRGTTFDIGAQYSFNFENDYFVDLGFGSSFGNNLASTYEKYTQTNNSYSTSTISYQMDDSTKAILPISLNSGISFGIKDKLLIAVDYLTSNWSDAIIYGSEGYKSDSRSIRFGVEYVPNSESYYNILERLEYRAGFHLDNSYLDIGSNQVKGYGITLGLGVPMRRSYSKVNFFVDYSKKEIPGTGTNYSENCLTFGLSLNLYERWFLQALYE